MSDAGPRIPSLRDLSEDRPTAYAPPRRPRPEPEGAPLRDLEATLADPEHGVAVGVSDLKFHQLISAATGIIAKSDKLKEIAPHELAAAMSGWALEKRSKPIGTEADPRR